MELAEAFETEAEVKNINANNLLTQILRHHVGYQGRMGRAGLIAFPKQLLIRLMESYPEKKAIAMAEYISQDPMTDRMFALKGNYTIESVLSMVEDWAKTNDFCFRLERKGQLYTCIIQHDLSRNWSLYLGHLYKRVIEELVQRRVAIDTTSKTVRLKF